MADFWALPDFDDHEDVHFFSDESSGLKGIIAIHSTALGPSAGGTRFWHYANPVDAVTDSLRLSRGMSYKNAMAGLPLGGGKGVILANPNRIKTPEILSAFATAIDRLGGRYITAEDVGMTDADMAAIRTVTPYVSGLPVGAGAAGGNPGPVTAYGVFLGIKAAAKHKLATDSLSGVRIAIQGLGSVGGGVARQAAAEGARLILADIDTSRAAALSEELGAISVAPAEILDVETDILSPNALGAIFDERQIERLRCSIVAGGANNQLVTERNGRDLCDRDILYAPDYVINAGGIINVGIEYLGLGDAAAVTAAVDLIPDRLHAIWHEADGTGLAPSDVADRQARALIGRE